MSFHAISLPYTETTTYESHHITRLLTNKQEKSWLTGNLGAFHTYTCGVFQFNANPYKLTSHYLSKHRHKHRQTHCWLVMNITRDLLMNKMWSRATLYTLIKVIMNKIVDEYIIIINRKKISTRRSSWSIQLDFIEIKNRSIQSLFVWVWVMT